MKVGIRYRQFRLRTILFAMLVVALVFGVVVPSLSQQRSREWVLSQKGGVQLEPRYRIEGAWYTSHDAWPLPRVLVDTIGIDFFASVTTVTLDGDEIYDLSGMKGLGRLEKLYINQFVHDKKTFGNLKNLRHLKTLQLSKWAGVSDDEVAAIMKSLPGVEIDAE